MAWIRENSFLKSRDFWMGVAIAIMFIASAVIIAPLAKRGYNRWTVNRYTRLATEHSRAVT